MLTIKYDPMDGEVVPEGRVRGFAKQVLEDYRVGKYSDVIVGCSRIVDEFRVYLHQGHIKPEEISFVFNGEVLRHDKNGRFAHWPKGFCDLLDEQLEALLSPV